MEEDVHLGGKFWLGLVGVALAIGVGALILFVLVDVVWYVWGGVATLLILILIVGLIGYFYDRRQQREYERLPT